MKNHKDKIVKIEVLKEWDNVLEKEISRLFIVSYQNKKVLVEIPFYSTMNHKNRDKYNRVLKKKYYSYLKEFMKQNEMNYSELLDSDFVSIIDSNSSKIEKNTFLKKVEVLRKRNDRLLNYNFQNSKETTSFSMSVEAINLFACLATNLFDSSIAISAFSYTTFLSYFVFSAWSNIKLKSVIKNSPNDSRRRYELFKHFHQVYMILGYVLSFQTVISNSSVELDTYEPLSAIEKEAIGDVDLDDILLAYDANVKISDEYQELIPRFERYLEDNSYLDTARLYSKAVDLVVYDNYELPDYVSGGYFDRDSIIYLKEENAYLNELTFYHELIHMTGCYKIDNSLCKSLSEGMTSLLCMEYFGSGRDLDEYDIYRKVVKILCEIVGPDVMLQSFSNFEDISSKDSVLYKAFYAIWPDDKAYNKLVKSILLLDNSFSNYMNDDFKNCEKHFEKFNSIFTDSIMPYINICLENPYFDFGTISDHLINLDSKCSDRSDKVYYSESLEEYFKALEKVKFE